MRSGAVRSIRRLRCGVQRRSSAPSRSMAVGLSGARWDSVGLGGTQWDSMGVSGNRWDSVVLGGLSPHIICHMPCGVYSVGVTGTWYNIPYAICILCGAHWDLVQYAKCHMHTRWGSLGLGVTRWDSVGLGGAWWDLDVTLFLAIPAHPSLELDVRVRERERERNADLT